MQIYNVTLKEKNQAGQGCLLERRRLQGRCRRAYPEVFTATCPAGDHAWHFICRGDAAPS